MQRVIGWLMAFVVMGYAQVYYELVPGWQLLGINNASVNMNDFNKSTVKAVWGYDKTAQKWKLYSPDEAVMQQASTMQSISALHQLNDKMGFWVLASEATSVLVNTQSNNIPLANCYPAVNTQAPVVQYVPIEHYIEYTDSVDTTNKIKWYGLSGGTIGHTYYLDLTSISTPYSNDDLYIQAYDDLGSLMSEDYLSAAGRSYVYPLKLRAGSKLYFKIRGGSSTAGLYSYSFKVYPGFEDGMQQDTVSFEPNDYQGIAYPVEYNKEYISQVLKTQDRQDWYVIKDVEQDILKTHAYYIQLTSISTPSGDPYNNLYIQAFDDTGSIMSEDYLEGAGGTYAWQVKPNVSGNIYFKIRGYTADGVYDYKFNVYPGLNDGQQQDPVSFEPNDYQAMSYPVEYNKEYTSQLLKQFDRADWYVIKDVEQDILKTHAYYIQLTSISTPSGDPYNNLYIQAFDDTGSIMSEDYLEGAGGTYAWQVKPNVSGNIYFKIRGYTADGVYDYKFNVYPGLNDGQQQDPVSFEPNDYQAMSYPVEYNKEYTSQLLKQFDRADWYIVKNVEAAKVYSIRLSSISTPSGDPYNNLYIQAFDDRGSIMSENYLEAAGGTNTWQVKPNVSGNIYFKIRGYTADGVYNYSFEVVGP